MNAAAPPAFWACAIACKAMVVLPEDSGPKISITRPRGKPPTPSATSSESDPVETAPMATWAWSFIFMTAPLPNWRSICPNTVSSACSRSIRLPTSQNVCSYFETTNRGPARDASDKTCRCIGRHCSPPPDDGHVSRRTQSHSSRLCDKLPHEVERGHRRAGPDRLAITGEIEPQGSLAHWPRRMQEDEPDRLLGCPTPRSRDAGHRHTEI